MSENSKSKINFIGIGAQKSGTSWLYKQFDKSDQINLPPLKELHYFDSSTDYPSPNFLAETNLTSRLLNPKWTIKALHKVKREKENRDWFKKWFFSDYNDEWYLSLFQDFDKCVGEMTPAYAILSEEDVANMIKLLGPETKIIFMLRNPIDRAWSSYKYMNRKEQYTSSDFEEAKSFLYSEYQTLRSNYFNTIELYKKYFKSIFIGFFDAIVENPRALLYDVFQYLELDTSEIEYFADLDKRINTSKNIKMPQDIELLLKNMYSQPISELASRYGGYFKKWDTPDSLSETHDFKQSLII